ncbi:hypothetical protein Tco_0764629 [Tanacetum coccineum]
MYKLGLKYDLKNTGCYTYTFLTLPRVPLFYQASACSLSTLYFLKLLENKLESMMILENKLESLKLLENKLESMKILENKLESLKSLKLQETDSFLEGEFGGSIWRDFLAGEFGGSIGLQEELAGDLMYNDNISTHPLDI